MKDKALEEQFLAQKPHFDDKADFMASLTRRLDAVEYVRQHQEATIRRYKSRSISATILALMISLGMMSIGCNIQDIMRIQNKYC